MWSFKFVNYLDGDERAVVALHFVFLSPCAIYWSVGTFVFRLCLWFVIVMVDPGFLERGFMCIKVWATRC